MNVPGIVTVFIPAATAIVTLLFGWFVTTRVTDHWERIRKRRDLDFAAAGEFQRLYGEFFAVWKIWRSAADQHDDEQAWICLQQASRVEGGVEALLAKIASEHRLSRDEMDAFGALRQGFSQLRAVIRAREHLPWFSSGAENYLAFKGLAAFASQFLGSASSKRTLPDRYGSRELPGDHRQQI